MGVETEAANDVTVWHIRVACWVSKSTRTHARGRAHRQLCNTYCFSTALIVSRTRLSVTLYVHCLSCLVLHSFSVRSEGFYKFYNIFPMQYVLDFLVFSLDSFTWTLSLGRGLVCRCYNLSWSVRSISFFLAPVRSFCNTVNRNIVLAECACFM